MTAQIPDSFIFNKRPYCIVGVKGTGLFDPRAMGLVPFPAMTACWRGYICQYKMADDKLLLDKLDVALGNYEGPETQKTFVGQAGPPISGIAPKSGVAGHQVFNNLYEHLELELCFTGALLLAADFIQELYVHMGFHPAWKYKSVFELIFENGRLLETRDLSDSVEILRNRMLHAPGDPGTPTGLEHDLETWIAGGLGLDYGVGNS